jgi:hypothetical protein
LRRHCRQWRLRRRWWRRRRRYDRAPHLAQ